jgi:negative regulator of flagellin synthesis FlgM
MTIKAGDLRIGAVTRVASAAPAASTQDTAPTEASVAPKTLAKSMAAAAPVDGNRVQMIKNAIANGTFPLSPSTIADQMIALKYQWMSNDKA